MSPVPFSIDIGRIAVQLANVLQLQLRSDLTVEELNHEDKNDQRQPYPKKCADLHSAINDESIAISLREHRPSVQIPPTSPTTGVGNRQKRDSRSRSGDFRKTDDKPSGFQKIGSGSIHGTSRSSLTTEAKRRAYSFREFGQVEGRSFWLGYFPSVVLERVLK